MSPSFAWAACLLLTGGVLFYIFYFQEDVHAAPEKTRLAYLLERKEVVYDNLRDLNFEYRAGKFPDADYQAMKASLELEAANVLAEIDRLESQALRRK